MDINISIYGYIVDIIYINVDIMDIKYKNEVCDINKINCGKRSNKK